MTLHLNSNRITDVGAAALAAALSESRALVTLGVSQNQLSSVGDRALADAAARSRNVSSLDVGDLDESTNQYVEDALARGEVYRRVLALHCALISGPPSRRRTPASSFIQGDGDHALGHRIAWFLLDPVL